MALGGLFGAIGKLAPKVFNQNTLRRAGEFITGAIGGIVGAGADDLIRTPPISQRLPPGGGVLAGGAEEAAAQQAGSDSAMRAGASLGQGAAVLLQLGRQLEQRQMRNSSVPTGAELAVISARTGTPIGDLVNPDQVLTGGRVFNQPVSVGASGMIGGGGMLPVTGGTGGVLARRSASGRVTPRRLIAAQTPAGNTVYWRYVGQARSFNGDKKIAQRYASEHGKTLTPRKSTRRRRR